jgi:hypothetical protein
VTSGDPVQERLDDRETSARQLLEQALRLAGRRLDHHRDSGPALHLALRFHRRGTRAASELDDTIAYLERTQER